MSLVELYLSASSESIWHLAGESTARSSISLSSSVKSRLGRTRQCSSQKPQSEAGVGGATEDATSASSHCAPRHVLHQPNWPLREWRPSTEEGDGDRQQRRTSPLERTSFAEPSLEL